MHASMSKTPTSEETFQILLDVMEKHFAALKLPELASEHKLTRAISFSELPSTRKIVIEQCYESPHLPGIVRQYSCEQIFDKTVNTREVKISDVVKTCNSEQKRTWTTLFPYVNSFGASEWNSSVNSSAVSAKKPLENKVERMDVDTDLLDVKQLETALNSITSPEPTKILPNEVKECSASTNLEQNLSCNTEQDKPRPLSSSNPSNIGDNISYENIKLKYRPLVPPQPPTEIKRRMSSCSFWKVLFFVLLPILALIIAAIFNHEEFGSIVVCSHSSDFFNATMELQDKVFGQRKAIFALSQALISDTPCIKLIALVGGTGIGKSYSVDIIKSHFPRPFFIYQYYSPLTDQFLNKEFWLFTCNLVVFENLDKHDLPYIIRYSKKLQNKENYCVTMLAIFNTQEINSNLQRSVHLNRDLAEIEKAFEKEQIKADVIGFEHLNEDMLKKCILIAAKDTGVKLSLSQIEDIKRGLLLSDTGCKGAYSKVQLLKSRET